MSQQELKAKDDALNQMIIRGQILAAIEAFYAPDVEMQENAAPPTRGRTANLAREEAFFAGLVMHEARLVSQSIGDDVTASAWRFDWTIGGTRSQLEQVAVRRWRDGRVISERFYYKG
jgi:SnoaL-like domain